MDQYIDLHTHRKTFDKDVTAVYNLLLHEKTDAPNYCNLLLHEKTDAPNYYNQLLHEKTDAPNYCNMLFHEKTDAPNYCNMLLDEKTDAPKCQFSAGLHPWHADKLSLDVLSALLDRLATDPNMVAFGETGLDKACDIPLKIQLDVFELHLEKAAKHNIPIILHCVRSWDELIEKASSFPIRKILHGYNGSAELTARLLREGFYFSVGSAILHPKSKICSSIHTIPLTSLFCETDTSENSIKSVYTGICKALNLEEDVLKSILFDNFLLLRSELK